MWPHLRTIKQFQRHVVSNTHNTWSVTLTNRQGHLELLWATHHIQLYYIPLQESGIPVPKHIIVSRERVPEGEDPPGFEDTEDYVSMNGALRES